MRRIRFGILLAVLIGCFAVAQGLAAAEPRPARILSLAPAATEILFDLGLGDRVVGVTRYCNWPPEARDKPVVGDIMQVNLEAVVAHQPDIVVLSNMNAHLRDRIAALGYPVVVVNQDNFEQICDSMLRVGEACGIPERAASRVAELRAEVAALRAVPPAEGAPTVLVVVGRDASDASFKQIYGAAGRSFYDDLLEEAGARNVLEQDAQYVRLSREGLVRLDPDVVVELLGEHGGAAIDTEAVAAQWRALADLRAARDGNVALVHGDFALRAGPRYPRLLRAFVDAIRNGRRQIAD